MDGMIPVGDEQERRAPRRRGRSVWIVARAWRGCVVDVVLCATADKARREAESWRRIYSNDGETDVSIFRRVMPRED